MTVLYQIFEEHLRRTGLDFKRYLYPAINWNSRMFGIVGPRGVGKTTLVLQHIKENHSSSDTLHVSNIGNMTFEVGGKSKSQKQIEGLKNAFVVKDDIEYGYQNVIPLWAFGLNY
jgi:predicted AAA+ superfamily ATPase